MNVILTEAELSLIIAALDTAYYEACNERFADMAEELRSRRDKAKELAAKKSLDWTGGDL